MTVSCNSKESLSCAMHPGHFMPTPCDIVASADLFKVQSPGRECTFTGSADQVSSAIWTSVGHRDPSRHVNYSHGTSCVLMRGPFRPEGRGLARSTTAPGVQGWLVGVVRADPVRLANPIHTRGIKGRVGTRPAAPRVRHRYSRPPLPAIVPGVSRRSGN